MSGEEAKRVAAGEAFMDIADPGWWREDIERAIDLTDFDISRPDACVLAQRCPLDVLAQYVGALNTESLLDGDMDDAYIANALRLSSGTVRDGETLTEWAAAHGFTGNSNEMPALSAEWKRIVIERRKANSRAADISGTTTASRQGDADDPLEHGPARSQAEEYLPL